MLLEETLQRIQSLYSKGVHSKDTRLTSRHIYSASCTARDILLGQQMSKNQMINQWSYQTIPCVELIKASPVECNMHIPDGCQLLRSKYKLPKIISAKNKHCIQSITTVDGNTNLFQTSFSNRKYADGNRYTSLSFRYYIHNEYIFITVSKELKAITIVALFSDPVDVYLYPDFCNQSCCLDIMTMEYPIDGDLVWPLIQMASKELVILMKQMTEDRSDNASDDASASGTMIHDPEENSNNQ